MGRGESSYYCLEELEVVPGHGSVVEEGGLAGIPSTKQEELFYIPVFV